MSKSPYKPHDGYRTKSLAAWEKKTIPEFYWDGEDHVWWKCPHMMNFVMLNNLQWHILKQEPLTVKESIHNHKCGCHGFINRGKWIPAGTQTPEKKELGL